MMNFAFWPKEYL